MNDLEERKRRYLLLFGLAGAFGPEELQSAYRTLAKLNHPDVAADPDAGMRMVIINEAYRFLRELPGDPRVSLSAEAPEDPSYEQYRQAFRTMSSAFDDYFGEGGRRGSVGDLETLRVRLREAKMQFAVLVDDMEYNPYVDDAIDRIASINKWLE
jgi:DnaJ-class molecular chaperone